MSVPQCPGKQFHGGVEHVAKQKKNASEQTSVRMPPGWIDRTKRQYAKDLDLPEDHEVVTFTGAVVYALAQTFGLEYSQEANAMGRPAKTYRVSVATKYPAELVHQMFQLHSQPWQIATLEDVVSGDHVPMTVVTLTSDDDSGFKESSTMNGRTIGLRLAREIAATIDDAGRQAAE